MSKKILSQLSDTQTINLLKQRALVKTDENQLEFVSQVNGVGYLCDSKSIRVSETRNALEQIDTPVILIIGGDDKNNDYAALSQQIKKKVIAIIYLGEESNTILQHYSTANILFTKACDIEEAVKIASYIAHKNDVVLLSPAYEHSMGYKALGTRFKKEVNSLLMSSKNAPKNFLKIDIRKER